MKAQTVKDFRSGIITGIAIGIGLLFILVAIAADW